MVKRSLSLLLSLFIFLLSAACTTVEHPDGEGAESAASSAITVATYTDGAAFLPDAPEGEKYNNLDFGTEGDKLYAMVTADF